MAIAPPTTEWNRYDIKHGDTIQYGDGSIMGIFCITPKENYFGGLRMIRRIGYNLITKAAACQNMSLMIPCRIVLTEKIIDLNPVNIIIYPHSKIRLNLE